MPAFVICLIICSLLSEGELNFSTLYSLIENPFSICCLSLWLPQNHTPLFVISFTFRGSTPTFLQISLPIVYRELIFGASKVKMGCVAWCCGSPECFSLPNPFFFHTSFTLPLHPLPQWISINMFWLCAPHTSLMIKGF